MKNWKKKLYKFIKNLQLCLSWTADHCSGDFIEYPNYSKSYMGFNSISQDDLDLICKIINVASMNKIGEPIIGNSMGEIIPSRFLTE